MCWSSQFYLMHPCICVVMCMRACLSVSFQVVTRPSLVWRTCVFTCALTLEKGHIPASLLAAQRHSQTRQIVPSISEHIMSRWRCILYNCLVMVLYRTYSYGYIYMYYALVLLLVCCLWLFPTPPIVRNLMRVHTPAVPKGTLTQVPYGSMSEHTHCQGRRYICRMLNSLTVLLVVCSFLLWPCFIVQLRLAVPETLMSLDLRRS